MTEHQHLGRWFNGQRLCLAILLPLMMAVPELAHAHGSVETMGNFYGGLLHPLFVPAHIIGMLVIGLLIGQNGMHDNQLAMLVFVVALAAGLALSGAAEAINKEVWLLIAALVTGLLVVLALRLPQWASAVLAAIVACLIGMDSGPETITGSDRIVILCGTGFGVTLCFLYVVAVTDFLKRPWQKIGIRVLGSWVTASAMIVLALLTAGDKVPAEPEQTAAEISLNER